MQSVRYLTKRETAARYRCHEEHLMKKVRKDPSWPQPVKFDPSPNARVFFVESEVGEHQQRLLDSRPRNRHSPDGCQDVGENGPSQSQGQHEGNSERARTADEDEMLTEDEDEEEIVGSHV